MLKVGHVTDTFNREKYIGGYIRPSMNGVEYTFDHQRPLPAIVNFVHFQRH